MEHQQVFRQVTEADSSQRNEEKRRSSSFLDQELYLSLKQSI
jgi:hypothetical protein